MQNDQAADVVKQVQAAITRAAELNPHSLEIRFGDGILTIAGEVDQVRRKKLVLNAIERVPEVRGVSDNLRVHRPDAPGDGATRDLVAKRLLEDINFQNCAVRIRTRGRVETLRSEGSDSCGSIEIELTDGVATLRGHVISLSHKRLAGCFAWWSRGCRDVVNLLQVIPGEEDNDDEIEDALRLVLECDPGMHADRIVIACHEGVVTLRGVVASDNERRRAEEDAWCVFGVRQVVGELAVG